MKILALLHFAGIIFEFRRWLHRLGFEQDIMPLRSLCESELIHAYPPLCDVPGSYVA